MSSLWSRTGRAVCRLTEHYPLPEKQAFGQAEKKVGKIIGFFSIKAPVQPLIYMRGLYASLRTLKNNREKVKTCS